MIDLFLIFLLIVPFIFSEEPDTKRIDVSQVRKETGEKLVSWEVDAYVKPVLTVENSIVESATEVNLSRDEDTRMRESSKGEIRS